MKTLKGNSYSTLLNVTATDTSLTLHFSKLLPTSLAGMTTETALAMIPLIHQKITQERKPYATFIKQLERIETYREQLIAAYSALFECYHTLTSPSTRISPVDKARQHMLETVTDMKMLRSFCTKVLGETADQFILPDAKEKLIMATVTAMKAQSAVVG